MKITIPKTIGKTIYHFQVEGENLHAVLMESQKLSFQNVKECGICKSENLYLRAYITEKDKYEYVKIQCVKCRASLTFGKSKSDKDTYFLRKKDNGDLDWQEYKEESGKKADEPEISPADKIFYDKCKELAVKDRDAYDGNLFEFGEGKIKSAKDIPVDQREKFLQKFKKTDNDSDDSKLPF